MQNAKINFNAIGITHYPWVERMGWHNKSVLESIALIWSEIGEATAECFTHPVSDRLAEELADIVLRTTDLAQETKVDLNHEVPLATFKWNTLSLLEQFAQLGVEMAKWSNTVRKETLGDDFAKGMATILAMVASIADEHDIDLEREVQRKMAINHERGTRGRKI